MRTYHVPLYILSLLCLGNLTVAQTTAQRNVTLGPKLSTPDQSGHYFALVIGEVHYKDFLPLSTPGNDASEIAKVLKDNYGFKINLLLDATRDEILGALDEYGSSLQPEDNLLVYFAGHGWHDERADQAYWIPVDGQRDKKSRWINAADITGDAKGIAARHMLIISDSCYSGTLADERSINPIVNDPILREHMLQKAIEGKSRHLMSSGGDEPVSDVSAPGESSDHSVFANALLEGLRKIDRNEFTGMELYFLWVHDQVAGQSRQQPEYDLIRDSGHNSGDFVFFRLAPPPPPANKPPFNFKKVFSQATALERKTRWADAAALLQGAEPQTNGKNLEDVMEHEATDFQNAKMYDQAAQEYQKLIAANPGNASYHSALGSTYASAGKMPDAEAECAKTGQTSPPDGTRCYLNLGAISNNAGKPDDAARAFQKATRLDPKNAEAWFQEGQALMAKATTGPDNRRVPPPGTVEAFQTYLQLQPHGTHAAAAHTMLNSIQPPVQPTLSSTPAESNGGGAGDRTAPNKATQARGLQDSSFKQAFDQALALERQRQWAQAASVLHGAEPQANGKNLKDVMEHEAADLQNAEMYDQAAQEYQRLIADNPGNASYLTALGTAYASADKVPDAEAECAKAGQTSPPDGTRCYLNLGAISKDKGKIDVAARAFRKATQLDPQNAGAFFFEGQALMAEATKGPDNKTVAPPGTVEALQTYLQLQPHGTHAAAAHTMLNSIQPPVQRTLPSVPAESNTGGVASGTSQTSAAGTTGQTATASGAGQTGTVSGASQTGTLSGTGQTGTVSGAGQTSTAGTTGQTGAPKHLVKTFHVSHKHLIGSCEGELTIGNDMIKYQSSRPGGDSFESRLEDIIYDSSIVGGGFYVRPRGEKLWEFHAHSLEDMREIFQILGNSADYK